MRRVLLLAAAVLLVCAAGAPAAHAATTAWRVTAVLTGSAADDVTATARCPARFAEQVSGLRMTLRSKTIMYDSDVRVLTGPLRWTLRGRWHVTGSYTAAADQPDGTPACAAQPTPVDCGAAIIADDGRRTALHGGARLAVDDNARGRVGVRIGAPRLTERYADAGRPPSGWPSVCRVETDDPNVLVTPLFTLATTGAADRALGRRLLIPMRRLARHRTFTMRGPGAAPNACPTAQGFEPCTERGSFRLRVTFRPARAAR
jgi:hypothetical protein